MLEVAGELYRQGSARAAHAEVTIVGTALVENDGHRGQRDHIVDHSRLTKQPLDRRQGRLEPHQTPLAFEALQQGGFLAAHIGAGPQSHFEMERLARAQQIVAEISARISRGDRRIEGDMRMGVFAAQINVAPGRPDRQTGDRHALDQHERVAFHDHAVRKRTGIALIGVADNVLLIGWRIEHGPPLDAGREGGATATAQAGIGDFVDDGGGFQRQGAPQSSIPVVGDVILQADRVGDAHAREGEALLIFQIRNLVGRPQRQGVSLAFEETGLEQ